MTGTLTDVPPSVRYGLFLPRRPQGGISSLRIRLPVRTRIPWLDEGAPRENPAIIGEVFYGQLQAAGAARPRSGREGRPVHQEATSCSCRQIRRDGGRPERFERPT